MTDSRPKRFGQAPNLFVAATALVLVSALLLLAVPAFAASVLDLSNGVYRLHDHRDGSGGPPAYGLRLDGLLTGDANDIQPFDFDGPGAAMFMSLEPGSARIYGTAYGGLDTGANYASPEIWDLDMSYVLAAAPDAAGRWGSTGVVGSNRGTITRHSDGQVFDLKDFGGPPSFLIGFGHRAPVDVLSGNSASWFSSAMCCSTKRVSNTTRTAIELASSVLWVAQRISRTTT